MISERTLRKWRRDTLVEVATLKKLPIEKTNYSNGFVIVALERILKTTQELLDQHLMRR